MSTKTTFKRVALVAVAALGLGVLTSVAPASQEQLFRVETLQWSAILAVTMKDANGNATVLAADFEGINVVSDVDDTLINRQEAVTLHLQSWRRKQCWCIHHSCKAGNIQAQLQQGSAVDYIHRYRFAFIFSNNKHATKLTRLLLQQQR
jgi:hypothetical protein